MHENVGYSKSFSLKKKNVINVCCMIYISKV